MNRIALVIGNSDYIHCSKLKNPSNDIRTIKTLLEQANFDVHMYENLDFKSMRASIDEFGKQLDKYECALVFYAGHGIQVGGINYLIPIDAYIDEENQIDYQCVRADMILSWMYKKADKTNILILDACRDNPFDSAWAREINNNGFAPMSAPTGTLISFSTSPGKTASDGNGNNSPFTEAVGRNLLKPNLKIEDIFKLIRAEVLTMTGNKQLTWETTCLLGDFYFVQKVITKEDIELTAEKIHAYMENTWDKYYENGMTTDRTEALAFIDASEHLGIPIIEIMRNYCIIQNRTAGIRVSNEEIDVLNMKRLTEIGFVQKFYRWFFEEKPVRVGEPLKIPSSLELQNPEEGKEIDVKMQSDYYYGKDLLRIIGTTNLPNETELMISLLGNGINYFAQSKATVINGQFHSEWFTSNNSDFAEGRYTVQITTPVEPVQPENVRVMLGHRGRNLTGDIVKFDLVWGNTVEYEKVISV